MKGDVIRYESRHGTTTEGKRDIGGDTYVVRVIPLDDARYSHIIVVSADSITGEDHGHIESNGETYNDYSRITSRKIRHGSDLAKEVSKAVNKAVKHVNNKMETISSNEDAVLGALEANAEVHDDG